MRLLVSTLLSFAVLFLLMSPALALYGESEGGVSVGLGNDGARADASGSASTEAGNNRSAQTRALLTTGVDFQSDMSVTAGNYDAESRGALLRASLSNGNYAYIRVLPQTASAQAQSHLNASCDDNNCSVELKEVGSGSETKTVYEVEVEKPCRVFGVFQSSMTVKADVDVETGEVISVNKPWWAFVAAEA